MYGDGGWWHEELMENVLRHPDLSHDGVMGDGVKVRHGEDEGDSKHSYRIK